MSGKSFKEIKDMSFDELWRYCFSEFGAWILSILGALGIAFSNYTGLASLLQTIANGALAATKVGLGFLHGISIAAGAICGGAMNLIMFRDLLDDFLWRFIKRKDENGEWTVKPKPEFKNNTSRVKYVVGILAFVLSGLLYGAMAFAISSTSPIAILGIIAGILVGGLSTIQELETWLSDEEWNKRDPKAPADPIGTKGTKIFGLTLTTAEVIVLSLLFAAGFVTFLTHFHVPVIIALTVGSAVAVPTGLFTQKTFYKPSLTRFCNGFRDRFKALKTETKAPGFGLAFAIVNGLVNGALAYVGMSMLIGVIATAVGVAAPPLGAVLAIGIVVAIIAATASMILGMEFWIKKMPKKKPENIAAVAENDEQDNKPLLDDKNDHNDDPDLGATNVTDPTKTQGRESLNSSITGSDTMSPAVGDDSDSSSKEEASDTEATQPNADATQVQPSTADMLNTFGHFQAARVAEAALPAGKPANDRTGAGLAYVSHFKPANRGDRQSHAIRHNINRASVG